MAKNPAPGGGESDADLFRGKKKQYYQRLTAARDELVEQVQALSGYSLATEKPAGEELADVGSDNFLREMELGLMTEEGDKLQLVLEALERLRTNTYGVCQKCGAKIQEGRLEAIPYAKYCVPCKAKMEQEGTLRPAEEPV